MNPQHTVTIVLLAGGRATRLPGKLALPIGGEPMLIKVHRQLTRTGRPSLISVRESLPPELAFALAAPVIVDIYEDAGPLGGLASAVAQVRTPLLFAAAGDLPNLDASLVDALEELGRDVLRRQGRSPDVILPRHENGTVEPLAALYQTAPLRASAARALALGRKKVTQALEGLHVVYYDIPACDEQLFVNINTAADLAGLQPL